MHTHGLLCFFPCSGQVTEVAYLESESLQKALSEIGMSEKGEWNAPDEVLRLIASAERSSEHPLAKVFCGVDLVL